MLPKKMPVAVLKDSHIIKIAVKFENHTTQFISLDQKRPLTGKIQELCSFWNITDFENYALQFCEQNKYVTEKNRNEIKIGSVLSLQYSPSKTATDFLEILRSGSTTEKISCLTNLSQKSVDLTFALEFIKEQGLQLIIGMIEDASTDTGILKYSLSSFVELMEHGTVSWEIIQTTFIVRNINIVCNYGSFPKECSECALSNLENIVQNSSKYLQVEKDVTLPILLKLFQEPNSLVIQQNAVALINALFMKGDETRKRQIASTLSMKENRSLILSIVHNSNIGTEMAHQLYVLQTLTLGLLENRMRMKINSQDQEAHDKIKELRQIAFDDFSGGNGDELLRRGGNVNFSQYYKKLGFKCDINPVQDFIETPPGILALDCMVYFARNNSQQYTKVVHENSCRADEHECPFGRTSIELVKLLCDILRIGDPPSEQLTDYHPMFFKHDHPFEEFFSVCIVTLNRTWKDMRATAEDFQKVFSVVREQITRTLKTRPVDSVDFRSRIATLNYQTITSLRQQERTSKEECESTASAIVKLKDKITPEILELIKKQRLNFLVEGTRYSRYSRVARSKDKFWYARLSPDHKVIHYGDCDEKTIPTIEELPIKVLVIDIKQLLVGKECPHTKELRARKSAINLGFSITFDNIDQNHATLDFVAPDDTTFNYWTDGINALLGQEMVSKQQIEDFETLLSMEIKLRLLDTEGVDISKDPPPIPEDPENYDFCFES